MNTEEVLKRVEELRPWWHSFRVDGIQIKRDDQDPPKESATYPFRNWELTKPLLPDLKNKFVLDIGCNAGFFSIEAAKLGANVMGVDSQQDGNRSIEQANLMREVLLTPDQQRVTAFMKMDFMDMVLYRPYNVIFFCGVYYHLSDHKAALPKIANMMSQGGHLFMETAIEEVPRYLPPNHAGDSTNCFVPSPQYVLDDLKANGFEYVDGWNENRGFAGHRQMFHAIKK